jgi:GMP synthase-like glutamine amidotransferase
MPRWIVLQHVPWEGPGAIGAEAGSRGVSFDICRLDLGHLLPAPGEIAGLIVMGGPMGVYEADQHRFLAGECRLIAEVVRCGKPVLGVCLGAQLLAAALQARVYPGPAQEIGFGTVELTADARRDPVFGALPEQLPVFHWHGDTFDLPRSAVLLAKNLNSQQQAFRFGENAYGLQFHVEVDPETWDAWKPRLPQSAAVLTAQQLAQIQAVGKQLFTRFFDAVLRGARDLGSRPGLDYDNIGKLLEFAEGPDHK